MLSDFIIYAISISKIASRAFLKFELKRPKRPETDEATECTRTSKPKEKCLGIFSAQNDVAKCSFGKVKRVFPFFLCVFRFNIVRIQIHRHSLHFLLQFAIMHDEKWLMFSGERKHTHACCNRLSFCSHTHTRNHRSRTS